MVLKTLFQATPKNLLSLIYEAYEIDFDACPNPRPSNFDGLTCEWGNNTYCNPPFDNVTEWVKKAIIEAQKGKRVIFVNPVFYANHLLLTAGAKASSIGRVKWLDLNTHKPAPFAHWVGLFDLNGRDPPIIEAFA